MVSPLTRLERVMGLRRFTALLLYQAAAWSAPQAGVNLDVSILDQGNQPVPAIRVQLKAPAGAVSSAETDQTGHVEFSRLPPARYVISVAKEGFRCYRVRDHGDIARIELAMEELPDLLSGGRRERMVEALKQLGYRFVTVDLEGYRRGGVSLPSPA